MGEAGGAGDIDAAVNQWIQAAHEYGTTMPVVPRIESPPRMPSREFIVFSARRRRRECDLDADIARCTMKRHRPRRWRADHLPRHRVDCGLAGRKRQAGLGDGADAGTGCERHAGARRAAAKGCNDERAVGHIGIVSGILDDTGASPIRSKFGNGQGKCDALTVRQRNLDRIGKAASHQRFERSAGGGGRTSASRPAAPQSAGGRSVSMMSSSLAKPSLEVLGPGLA